MRRPLDRRSLAALPAALLAAACGGAGAGSEPAAAPGRETFYVTGKLWPKLFEVRISP